MREGKPIIEAREYREQERKRKEERELGFWCDYISARSTGFVCLKSPVRELYKEPCVREDLLDCPFKP